MANPCALAFQSVEGLEDYAHPGALVITGRGNREFPEFQRVREAGGLVLPYVCPIEIPVTFGPVDASAYMGDAAKVPRWSPARTGNYGQPLADITRGSAWSNWHLNFCAGLLRDERYSGLFVDMVGGQLRAVHRWESWPQEEQERWIIGNVDYMRRLHELRMQIDPRKLLVNNNFWGERPWDLARAGEHFTDGVVVEHHARTEHKRAMVQRRFGGPNRCVIVIANNRAEALEWAQDPNITHVCDQATSEYKAPKPPFLPFVAPPPSKDEVIAGLSADLQSARARVDLLEGELVSKIAERNRLADELGVAQTAIGGAHSILSHYATR